MFKCAVQSSNVSFPLFAHFDSHHHNVKGKKPKIIFKKYPGVAAHAWASQSYSKTFLGYINVITVKLKNHGHQEYLCNVILLQRNNQSGVKKKLNCKKQQ